MRVQLHDVLPFPLRETPTPSSSVWQKTVDISAGSIVEVQAPSGRGKSTLLSICYGARKDYEGTVLLGEQPISNWSPGAWAAFRKHKVAMLFQGLELFPQLTAVTNIQLKNRLTNHLSASAVEDFAQRLGIVEHLHRPVGQLSFGQQQRVALIRALAMPFSLLLLDEPFSHLDAALKQTAWTLIQETADRQQATVLLATLDPSGLSGFQSTLTL